MTSAILESLKYWAIICIPLSALVWLMQLPDWLAWTVTVAGGCYSGFYAARKSMRREGKW